MSDLPQMPKRVSLLPIEIDGEPRYFTAEELAKYLTENCPPETIKELVRRLAEFRRKS